MMRSGYTDVMYYFLQCSRPYRVGQKGVLSALESLKWVAVKELKLDYHNGYIYQHLVINKVSPIE